MALTQEQYREGAGRIMKAAFPNLEGEVTYAGCSYGIVHQQTAANGEKGAFVEVTFWVPEEKV